MLTQVLDRLPADRPARIVIFSVSPLWTPHFATELELASVHRDRGDDVHVVHCRGAIPSSMPNPNNALEQCLLCRSQSERGFEAAGIPLSHVHEIRPDRAFEPRAVPEPDSVEELRSWKWDGADLGEAAVSSLVTVLRDPLPDLSEHRALVTSTMASAVGVYQDGLRWLEKLEPDLAYIFNGRTATTRPLIRACERSDVRFACHDMGYELGTYRVVPGGMVHDLDHIKEAIHRTWEESEQPLKERIKVGCGFFEGRRFGGEGAPPEQYRFSSGQSHGVLPPDLDPNRHNIGIFNSSEDEFAAISEYRNPIYPNQMAALEAIVSDPCLADVDFYLRVHPNLAGVANQQTRHLASLNYDNLTVIAPGDPVDTYELIETVDSVVTFGSTTGVEALYLGTPSILVGRALYEDLGCVRPGNHEDVVRAILAEHSTVDRDLAIRYGYYQRKGATPFRRFSQDSYHSGSFDGVPLEPRQATKTIAKLLSRIRLVATDPKAALSKMRQRLSGARSASSK